MSNEFEKASKKIKEVVEAGWKDDAPDTESAEALLSEATVSVYNEVHNHPGFSVEQKKACEEALDEVKHNAIPKLDKGIKDVQYLNQVGGAANFVKSLMLEKVAVKADSPEFMRDLLSKGTAMFFHVSGWERFTDPKIWEDTKRFLK